MAKVPLSVCGSVAYFIKNKNVSGSLIQETYKWKSAKCADNKNQKKVIPTFF